ncbi:FAD-binding oxidoreductase [Lewinella cohaerens]|uniref:FAD-binding oxidoreductase n=1 Tax=Lewinella cohaerens TaxID=70995 RepID=UPI000374BB1C|nr:FAD-binding oxidoreductase [Lewinella cohaerens]
MKLYNWGKSPSIDARLHLADSYSATNSTLNQLSGQPVIPRGNGRCYGDSALQKNVCSTLKLNKLLQLDEVAGVVRLQAGVLLEDLLSVLVPKGLFLPVIPGTRLITIGGAIAANVHGKNHHHAGAFGNYVQSFSLLTADGQVLLCSRTENKTLFKNTIGGMGTTGIVLEATLQLSRIETSYYQQQSYPATSLSHLFELFEQQHTQPYLVAWIDGLASGNKLGRGVLHTGKSCTREDLESQATPNPLQIHPPAKLSIPGIVPSWFLQPIVLRLNNGYYRWSNRKSIQHVKHYASFFFPLDAIKHWNNLYGKKGLLQYQFVLPLSSSLAGITAVLEAVKASRLCPYLVVLKRMGEHAPYAATDFPMSGYSLAIDFKYSPKVLDLFHLLDEIVIQHSGRIYLTKDARLPAAAFRKMYPAAVLHSPQIFRSLQSERLFDL